MSNAMLALLIGSLASNLIWLLVIFNLQSKIWKMQDEMKSLFDSDMWRKFLNN